MKRQPIQASQPLPEDLEGKTFSFWTKEFSPISLRCQKSDICYKK
jgi:hypothetical protein